MHGPLSRRPLEHLLAAGFEVCAVVIAASPTVQAEPLRLLPAPRLALPLLGPQARRGIVEIAAERQIPVLSVTRLAAPEARAQLAALRPGLGCVACFPRRIPPELLGVPPLGFLNLHPSALPAYRGPAPIFWQLRDGLTRLGLTVHLMDEGFDTGPTLAQSWLELADGMRAGELDTACGDQGGRLLVQAARSLFAASARPHPQPGDGSYQPWPRAHDFRIEPGWTVRRAFNFLRATADWQQPYAVTLGGTTFLLREALAYEPGATLGHSLDISGEQIALQLQDGVLQAWLAGRALA